MNAQKALPPTDLSSSFAKPSRAAGLRLPTTRPAKKANEGRQGPIAPMPDPEPTEALKTPQSGAEALHAAPSRDSQEPRKSTDGAPIPVRATDKAAPASKTAPAKAPAQNAGTEPDRLVLWTPKTIRTRMKARQDEFGKPTYLDQVLDALEATVDVLPELIAKNNAPAPVQGLLFERTVAPPVDEREGRVQLTIRGVLKSQLAVIDRLRAPLGVSRSALCNAALDEYLQD